MNDTDFQEQQELSEQASQSEEELYYAILDALQTAKNLGLETDKLKILFYATGVSLGESE